MVAFFLDFLLVALEALLLMAVEVGFFFVVGLFFLVNFDAVLLGFVVDGATAAPYFFFLLSPILFFSAFAFFTLASPNIASRDWLWQLISSVVLSTLSWMRPLRVGQLAGRSASMTAAIWQLSVQAMVSRLPS